MDAILLPLYVALFVINIITEIASGTGIADPALYRGEPKAPRTAPAPCSAVAECQEVSKAHTPDAPATTNSEEDN